MTTQLPSLDYLQKTFPASMPICMQMLLNDHVNKQTEFIMDWLGNKTDINFLAQKCIISHFENKSATPCLTFIIRNFTCLDCINKRMEIIESILMN